MCVDIFRAVVILSGPPSRAVIIYLCFEISTLPFGGVALPGMWFFQFPIVNMSGGEIFLATPRRGESQFEPS